MEPTPIPKHMLRNYRLEEGVLVYRPNKFRVYWDRWLTSWTDLADGLSGVLTLGLWKPGFSFRMVTYQAKRNCRRSKVASDYNEEKRVRRAAF